jgi:hypothetical protein
MDEPVQFTIEGNAPAPAKRHTAADTNAAVETEKTRSALREATAWKNELLLARREQAAVHLDRINTEAERAAQTYQEAWDAGDAAAMAASQRDIAALEVRRHNTQSVAERLDRTQPAPIDPVEAFAEGRSAQAQAWIRSHPEFVLNERKAAKLSAAHSDAIAEGVVPDTAEYFAHVNKFIGEGGESRRRGSDNATLRVRVGTPNSGERLGPNEVRLTPGEYSAATEGALVWNHDSPDGKFKKGDSLGVAEYLRRKDIMSKQPGWYDKLD